MASVAPTTLREAALGGGLHCGTCVMPDLLDDPLYAATIAREFTHVVVEHHMKWEPMTSPTAGGSMWGGPYRNEGRSYTPLSGCYDFGPADKVVDWALANGLRVKGHTLCWHVTSPAWLDALDGQQVAEALRRHIFTTCGHFRGRVESWDVVNEALAPDGSLAETVFLRKIGPGYIAQAFRWARQADPDAILLYNDNKVEGASAPVPALASRRRVSPVPTFYRKSDAMYRPPQDRDRSHWDFTYVARTCAWMVGATTPASAQGVPIHGVGLQAHFNAAGLGLGRCPTPAAVQRNVARLTALGLSVNISEMDVRISRLPDGTSDADRTAAQVQIYRDIVGAACAVSGFAGVTLWGFTDKHSWVHEFYHADAPLIFDLEYKPKPAYGALRDALSSRPPEPPSPAITAAAQEQQARAEGLEEAAGSVWGEAWMQPEPADVEATAAAAAAAAAGSALPDWQQPS